MALTEMTMVYLNKIFTTKINDFSNNANNPIKYYFLSDNCLAISRKWSRKTF
jgi:hypothetical protein